MEKLKREAIIKKVFTDLKSPACYSSAENVFKEARKFDKSLSLEAVRRELEKYKTYTLHKARRIKFKRLKTIPSGFMTDMQADLADFQRVAKYNDGFRYLLVGIDVLSRRIFTAPVKSKSSKDMIMAFNVLFQKTPELPQYLFTDKGVEFQAKDMKTYFSKKNILKRVAQSPNVKAGFAERCIRTIKTRLYKYFTDTETLRWVDAVDRIVASLNKTRHRITRMRPIDVNFDNADELWEYLYSNANNAVKKDPRFKEGDTVRISKAKKEFEKGYLPNYTSELFTVDVVKKNQDPSNYRLVDMKGEEIIGKFYNEELARTNPGAEDKRHYEIEKVLESRTRAGKPEYYVKWKGLPLKFATWIRRSDIII